MKMIKFDASEKRRAFRAFIWFALYYGLEIFIAAYLAQFEEITGVNAVLVFVPLIILAISTESMSKKMDGERINLRPWANVDFCAKALAFIFAQMIFRFPQNGALVIVMWVLVALCVVCSLTTEIVAIKKANRHKDSAAPMLKD